MQIRSFGVTALMLMTIIASPVPPRVMAQAANSQDAKPIPTYEIEAVEGGYTALDRRGLLILIEGLKKRIAELESELEASESLRRMMGADKSSPPADKVSFFGIEDDVSYHPEGAIEFQYDAAISINMPIVEAVEFTQKRCNITLNNRLGKAANVDIQVIVMNADGVILWAGSETWAIDMLADEQKYLASKSMTLTMPEYLTMSIYAHDFDIAPRWFVITDHGNN